MPTRIARHANNLLYRVLKSLYTHWSLPWLHEPGWGWSVNNSMTLIAAPRLGYRDRGSLDKVDRRQANYGSILKYIVLVSIHEGCKMHYVPCREVPHLGRIGTGRSRNHQDNKHYRELTGTKRLLWSGLDSSEHACCQPAGWCAAGHLGYERSYDTSIVLLAISILQNPGCFFCCWAEIEFASFLQYGTDYSDAHCRSHVSKYIKYMPDSPAQIHGALSLTWMV